MSDATGARAEWRAGWKVVLGATLGLGTGQSLYNYVASLFIAPLSAEFGWTRGQIAAATATGIIGVFLAPVIGRLADRFGVRRVIVVSILVLVAAYGSLAAMGGSLPLFYLSVLCLGLAGLGTTGITYTRAVSSWFERNRGFALGLSLAGVSLFAGLVPPILNTVIATSGWRAGYLLLGGLALFVGLPAAVAFVREKPRPISARLGAPMPWRRVLAAPPFWLLLSAIFVVTLSGSGIIGQLQPLLGDRGITPATAASLLSLYAAALLVGRVGCGFLLDRVSPQIVGAIAVAAPALGVALLIGETVSLPTAAFAMALLGISQGVEMDLAGFFIARYFGLTHYSTLFALMISALVLGNVGGNLLYGRVFDATGSYDIALTVGIGGFLVGGVAILALRLFRPTELSTASP